MPKGDLLTRMFQVDTACEQPGKRRFKPFHAMSSRLYRLNVGETGQTFA
jgi:hypothetical protein